MDEDADGWKWAENTAQDHMDKLAPNHLPHIITVKLFQQKLSSFKLS